MVINPALLHRYRFPDGLEPFAVRAPLSGDSGYFQFGSDLVCYGRHGDIAANGSAIELPFDPCEVVTNLQYERYGRPGQLWPAARRAYYAVRPLLPTPTRRLLQRFAFRDWESIRFPQWPVDATVELLLERLLSIWLETRQVESIPFIWFWPDGAPGCAIMTHDVEAPSGRDFCHALMDLDDAAGIKASFQIVPEDRYPVRGTFLDGIRRRGFEVNVHDLNHDGYLFIDRERFLERAARINEYGKAFGATGFRSGALYRNLDWYHALDFSYDMSVPTIGHLEAQRGGCCSVMPFFVGSMLELPVTTTQDYSIFHILHDYSLDLWKRQIAAIGERHGLASFIVHPDYVREPRAQGVYRALLAHLANLRAEHGWWIALPRDVDRWWRQRSQMTLAKRGDRWTIEGEGHERARVAYAGLEDGRLVYRFDQRISCGAAARPDRTAIAV